MLRNAAVWFEGTSGALVYNTEFYEPSEKGCLMVESAGGKVLIQKRLVINQVGYMGLLIDSEGNSNPIKELG